MANKPACKKGEKTKQYVVGIRGRRCGCNTKDGFKFKPNKSCGLTAKSASVPATRAAGKAWGKGLKKGQCKTIDGNCYCKTKGGKITAKKGRCKRK